MVIDLFRFSISSCVTFWDTYSLEKWLISFSLQRCWDKIVSNLKLLIRIIKQQKFNQVNFKALTGFIEQLMNQVAYHLPSRKALGGAEQKGRRLQAEGGGGVRKEWATSPASGGWKGSTWLLPHWCQPENSELAS